MHFRNVFNYGYEHILPTTESCGDIKMMIICPLIIVFLQNVMEHKTLKGSTNHKSSNKV